MSTYNERESKKSTKRVSTNNYSHWVSKVRQIGIDNNMTLCEVKKRINIHSVGDMFQNKKTPKQAFAIISKMTKDERIVGLIDSINQVKDTIIGIVDIIHLSKIGDTETANQLLSATKSLQYYQTEYNRLYIK